jgi:uncharacterized membrane protein
MAAPFDVAVHRRIAAPPERVAAVMFNPRRDPDWMKAVRSVQPREDAVQPGARVQRTGRFLGRELRWTTEVLAIDAAQRLHLRIVEGSMRGDIEYLIAPTASGSDVTIRNTGDVPRFAPRWLLVAAMRRSLAADLERLAALVESTT